MNTSQAAFEEWYVRNAFDLLMNPIGSRDCDLQRKAWQAAMRQAIPDGWKIVPIEPTPEWIANLERRNDDSVELPVEAISECIKELLAAAPIFGQVKEQSK